MDTVRVDISYRPLRIGWVIQAGDLAGFRTAVRYSHALWGGRFNPVIIADRKGEARRLVDLFRVDLLVPVGNNDVVKQFPKDYPHVINPFFQDPVFIKGSNGDGHWAQALDVQNTLAHVQDKGDLGPVKELVRIYTWQPEDPLSDVLLVHLGGYPTPDEIGTDYTALLKELLQLGDSPLPQDAPLPRDVTEHPGVAYLARHGLTRHYGAGSGWDTPGFFVGSATDIDDLVCYWNLRACDIPLLFVDPTQLQRYSELTPAWEQAMRGLVAGRRHEWDRKLGVWSRGENLAEAAKPFGDMDLMRLGVSEVSWNGLNIRVPTMHLASASALGVMSRERDKVRVSFALPDKPFSSDVWFGPEPRFLDMS